MNGKIKNLIIGIIVAGVIGAILYYLVTPDKKIGLYQHIRKAGTYINEGKYEKAIFLLHKAYEEAPESERIRKELLAGYVRYARHLNKEGELNEAIDYMDMAYEMDPESELVIHDLAYYYAKKAVKEAEVGSPVMAIVALQKVTDIAVKSKKARRSIANYLYNQAVDAYKRKDGTTVLLCLNASYVLRPRFITLDFLGEYYYSIRQLGDALFYWQKALEIKPEDEAMRQKVEKVQKEIKLEDKMWEFETPYFEAKLYKEYSVDIGLLRDVLRKVYKDVGKDLEYYPPEGTQIMFYTEEDFRGIFKKSGIVRGFYDGTIRLIFIPDFRDPSFAAFIAHEYTHAIVSILTNNNAPPWLQEGIAVYEQSKYIPANEKLLKEVVTSGKKLTLKELDAGFRMMEHQGIVGLSYEGAYSAVEFIIDKWGWGGLRRLLSRIKEEGHFANALDEEYYISVSTFEEMWNEYLKKKFTRPS